MGNGAVVTRSSAGLLLFRRVDAGFEVLLVHPGGPFWARRDDGAWSVPKGEHEPDEDPLAAAEREFAEELGREPPPGPRLALGEVRQRGGKRVQVWALEGDLDPATLRSNTFDLEWPPGSGQVRAFPEVDRAEWMDEPRARQKLLDSQRTFLDRLTATLAGGDDGAADEEAEAAAGDDRTADRAGSEADAGEAPGAAERPWDRDPQWARAFAWVEATLGGTVVRAERQARWRPAWFLDVERDGRTLPLYWRGDRGLGDPEASPLRTEARVLEFLAAEGIPVPLVHGFCEDPMGILMDRVAGEVDIHRAAPDELERVAEDYLRVLARCHAIDPDRLVEVGLRRPEGPHSMARESVGRWERPYRAVAAAPAPLIELALWWLGKAAPADPGAPVLVHGDTGPGQFLYDGGRVTAVLDWEFCHLGDPMEDLALIRGRDLSYPFGDLRSRFRRYAELSGNPVDPGRLRYYSVLAMLITPAGLYPVLTARPRGADYAQVLAWNAVYSRALVQCLADACGIALEPVELPEPVASPRQWIHDVVVDQLRTDVAGRAGDDFGRYQVEAVALLADHLRLADRLGPAFDEADRRDAAALLGVRTSTREETDEAVQQLVRAAAAERSPELIRFLHRRTVRDEALLAPLLGELRDTATLTPAL